MTQSGTELFIATGGTKMQFMIRKENELKRVSDELTTQGKVIVNIIEGEIKRPLTGWWQEIRIIWKTADVQPTHAATVPQTKPSIEKVSVTSDNFNSILERIDLFLEDKEWKKAVAYCESALDFDPKNANIYLKYLLADCKSSTFEELLSSNEPFEENSNYQKALRFGDEEFTSNLNETVLRSNEQKELNRCQNVYDQAKSLMSNTNQSEESYDSICKLLKTIPGYKDADELFKICTINTEKLKKERQEQENRERLEKQQKEEEERIEKERKAEEERVEKERKAEEERKAAEVRAKKNKKLAMIITSIVAAVLAFTIVCTTVVTNNKYNNAIELMDAGKYTEAIAMFEGLNGYKDSVEKINICNNAILDIEYNKAIALLDAGNIDKAYKYFTEIGDYKDTLEKLARIDYSCGIKLLEEGKVVQAMGYFLKSHGYKDAEKYLMNWNAKSISAGDEHSVGLKNDGKVVTVGSNHSGQCDVEGWTDIVSISTSGNHTVGLKSDGTVVAVGDSDYGQCDVSEWQDIVAISAGEAHTVGLKSDGTVVAVGYNNKGQCNVKGWTDIVAIATEWHLTIGLKSDGTVVATGAYDGARLNEDAISGWTDIVAIATSRNHIFGLKSDGTVVATGDNSDAAQCDVEDWTDIVAISAGDDHTVGLKSDGTVVAAYYDFGHKYDFEDWRNIVAISVGETYFIGLKANGTVVSTTWTASFGYDDYDGQCDVSGWKNIKQPTKY